MRSLCALLAGISLSGAAHAFTPEEAKTVDLPENTGQPWFWVSGSRAPSFLDGQAYLFNERGQRLGQLSTGFWFNSLVTAPERGEILTVETYFSRGSRGKRTDVVTGYDSRSLSPIYEIEIPPKRMNSVRSDGLVNLTADERFLIIVNYTPAQSISIVDLDRKVFVEEIETPGCSVLFHAGGNDFFSICGNGGFLYIQLDNSGRVVARERTPPVFDAVDDFLTISPARIGDTWYFISRHGNVYAIRMRGNSLELTATWPLASEDELADDWIISGLKHTAANEDTGELFVLMHRGEPETFEEPGTHVWVYDVQTGAKLREIKLKDLAMSIALSQSSKPRLLTLDFYSPMPYLATLWMYMTEGTQGLMEVVRQRVSAYDANTGKHLFYSESVPRGGFVTNVQSWPSK